MATGPSKALAILLMLLIGVLMLAMPVSGKIPADTDSHYTPLQYFEAEGEAVTGPYLQFIGEDGHYYWGKLVVAGANQSMKNAVSQDFLYCTRQHNDLKVKYNSSEFTTYTGR